MKDKIKVSIKIYFDGEYYDTIDGEIYKKQNEIAEKNLFLTAIANLIQE